MTSNIGIKLINWYNKNKRDLPWRNTKDPYKIWLSEVILQQTRVDQGLNYYLKFTDRFPDVFALSKASSDEVYKMWQGLGYYNRADNLMKAANKIVDDYQGIFPQTLDELIKIPGIGPYTAAAVSSIAFSAPEAVVDGNVYRVLSRLLGIPLAINSSEGKKEFDKLAELLLDTHPPSIYNQAIMEFGALQCVPKNPKCSNCILSNECIAFNENKVAEYPVKNRKTKIRNRYFYYLYIESTSANSNQIILKRRSEKEIWRKLYDFPMLEFKARKDPKELVSSPSFVSMIKSEKYTIQEVSNEYIHQLTHQKIHAVFIRVVVDKMRNHLSEKSLLLVDVNELINYPVPRLIERYLQDQRIIKKT